MKITNFKTYFEATDIFGFDAKQAADEKDDNMLSKPIKMFDIELMMDLLGRKRIGLFESHSPFVSEIRWGSLPGAVKLEVDTGYTFYFKRLGIDRLGQNRWITKKMFQLNRAGYGGLEDAVAQEVYDHLSREFEKPVDSPLPEVNDYKDLENLTVHVYSKIKRTCKNIFIPEGIKKLNDNAYILKFGIRGHGVEAPDNRRVEQNQTVLSYDTAAGTIRIFNYNIESPVGGPHSWQIMENDIDLYFFPSQDREEISECLSVHFKYY